MQQQNGSFQIKQWKDKNPELAKAYGKASLKIDKMFHKMMEKLIEDLETIDEEFEDFQCSEFVTNHALQIQQLKGLLETLASLGTFE